MEAELSQLQQVPGSRSRLSRRRVGDKYEPARAPPRSLVVHAVAFAWFAFVWLWHLSPAASQLPGNVGFGWFFRFLTFWSFTLQTIQLGMATVDDVQRTLYGKSSWTRPTDDLACAIFAFTHVVSIMFYAIQSTTKLAVEGGHVTRPPWLDVSVHAFNTLVAWADLITADRRTFSRASERLSCGLVTGYLGFLMLCRQRNGRFPYPILNALSWPWGFSALIAAGLVIFVGAFRAGAAANRQLRKGASINLTFRFTERLSSSGGGGARASAGGAAGGGSSSEGSGWEASEGGSEAAGGGEVRSGTSRRSALGRPRRRGVLAARHC